MLGPLRGLKWLLALDLRRIVTRTPMAGRMVLFSITRWSRTWRCPMDSYRISYGLHLGARRLHNVRRRSFSRTSEADAVVFLHREAREKDVTVTRRKDRAVELFATAAAVSRSDSTRGQRRSRETKVDATSRKPRRRNGYSDGEATTGKARQGDIALLGAGRRASTIRSRVRNIRHFLAWLAINHGITYPTEQSISRSFSRFDCRSRAIVALSRLHMGVLCFWTQYQELSRITDSQARSST